MAQQFLGIDIGSRAVKFVLLGKDSAGKFRVLHAAVEKFDSPMDFDTEELPALVAYLTKKFLRLHKLRGVRTGFSIAGQSAFVRLAKVPAVAPHKIQQIVLYETQQQVPFPMRDVVWDHQVLMQEENSLQVLIAAVKKDFATALLKIGEEIGLPVEFIDVNCLALYNCITYFYRDLQETLIIDVGAKATNVLITSAGRLWTRSIPLGEEDIIENFMRRMNLERAAAEELIDANRDVLLRPARSVEHAQAAVQELSRTVASVFTDLAGEIVKTLNFFKGQEGLEIKFKKALFTGGATRWDNSAAFFEQTISFPAERIDFRNMLTFHPRVTVDNFSGFGPAIGLALRGLGYGRLRLTLCSDEQKAVIAFRNKKPWILTMCLLCVVVAGIWCVGAVRLVSRQYELLDLTQEKLAVYQQNEAALSRVDAEVSSYNEKSTVLLNALAQQYFAAAFLEALTKALPQPVWLTTVSFDADGRMAVVEGVCEKALGNISELQTALQKSTLVESIKVETVARSTSDHLSFSLRIYLRPLQPSRYLQ